MLVKEDNEEESEAEMKRKSLMEQVVKGKQINFSDYVDRDVAYIKNNTILTIEQQKTKEFDTKLNNRTGLFSKQTQKESKSSAGEVKYIQDKRARKSMKTPNSSSPVRGRTRKQEENVPDFLKKARGI